MNHKILFHPAVLRILTELRAGALRHGELQRRVGTENKSVFPGYTKKLLRDGLIERHVISAYPPATEYRISKTGIAMAEAAAPLLQWAAANAPQIETARAIATATKELERVRQIQAEHASAMQGIGA